MNKLLQTGISVACILFIPFQLSAQNYTEVAASAGVDHVFNFGDFHFGGGAAVFDFNNDDFEDLYVIGGANPDKLYQNNGDGTFTDVTAGAGFNQTDSVITMGAVSGDFDNDGFRDLFITVRSSINDFDSYRPDLLYHNNGDGTFTDISVSSGIGIDSSFSTSATLGDYNLDGYLDIYVLNFLGVPVYDLIDTVTAMIPGPDRPGSNNYLYMNNGNNTFIDVATPIGVVDSGCGWATTFTDIDNDADVDLWVANDFGKKTQPNNIYRNDGGSFVSTGVAAGVNDSINAMGVAVGDFDEDGWLDYYITDLDSNFMYRNNHDGTFQDVTVACGTENWGWFMPTYNSSVSWGANFLDYDNDTYLDLFVCNGALNPMIMGVDTFLNPNALYRNNGNYTFSDVATMEGVDDPQRGRGSITFDYNNDGQLDLYVANQEHYPGYGINTNPKSRLYRNDVGNGYNWYKVKLEGTVSNRDGIGSRVRIVIGSRSFIREIDGGSSLHSHNSTIAHFGLGGHSMIDTLIVTWPGGNEEVFINLPVNHTSVIVEGLTVGLGENALAGEIELYPNPAEDIVRIDVPQKMLELQPIVEWYDMTGRLIMSNTQLTVASQSISIEQLSKGVYTYRIVAGKSLLKQGKLIVQ
jgi:hypothetical protein